MNGIFGLKAVEKFWCGKKEKYAQKLQAKKVIDFTLGFGVCLMPLLDMTC